MKTSKWFSYENGVLLLLGFIFGLVFFERNAVGILSPFIVPDLGLNNTQLGLLNSGLALAWALSAYFVGAWSDRSGVKKPFLIVSIIIFSICSILSGLAGAFVLLLAARVVMGMAEGPFLPICLSIMNVESTPSRRGLNAGILQNVMASLLGTALAPILLVFLAQEYGWRVTFFISGIPGLFLALLVWKYLREPKSDGVHEELEADSDTDEASISLTRRAFQMLRDHHNIRICALISCFMVAWFLIGLSFIFIFLTDYRGFTPTEMGGLSSMMGIGGMIAGVLAPGLSDRIGRKPVMILFCFLSLLFPFTALYFDGPYWIMALLLLVGWAGAGTFPLFMGVIPGETVSLKYTATAMGLVVGVGELIGGFGGPWAAGWAADQSSLAAPMIAMAVCSGCAGLLSMALVETAPRKIKAIKA